MNQPPHIGAMVDYFSAAFWLDELRSPRGADEWVDRCSDLGLTLDSELQEDLMLSAARGGADELIFYDLCQEYNGERELWENLKPVFQRVLEEGRKQ